MILASQLRSGVAIRYQSQNYKVIASDYHHGKGKMGGAAHVRLRNLDTGTLWEHSFRSELRFEDIPLEKRVMEFLYDDQDQCCFMNPETYEQTEIPKTMVGEHTAFLEPGMHLSVEFLDGRPVSVLFPDVLEVKIADTAPPMHQQPDSAFKSARLANGIEIMVPQFVKPGDLIRLDLNGLRYMDRARGEVRKA